MRNNQLQQVIKGLLKWRKKIIYSTPLKAMIADVLGEDYTDTKAYKFLYYLKNRGYLMPIKKDIFFVKLPEDFIAESLVLEDYYRDILHHHCTHTLGKKWYIGGLAALELQRGNREIPDSLQIVNPTKQAKETIVTGKHVLFKKYTTKTTNHFARFEKWTSKIKVGKYSFSVANLELALLETLYNYDSTHAIYATETVKKVLKKIAPQRLPMFEQIIKLGKHHSSINRLYKLAKLLNPPLADWLSEVIKRNSFFLDVQ